MLKLSYAPTFSKNIHPPRDLLIWPKNAITHPTLHLCLSHPPTGEQKSSVGSLLQSVNLCCYFPMNSAKNCCSFELFLRYFSTSNSSTLYSVACSSLKCIEAVVRATPALAHSDTIAISLMCPRRMFLLLSVSSNYHKSEHKKPQLVILLLVLWALAAEGREGEHASSSSMIWKKDSPIVETFQWFHSCTLHHK